MTRHYWVLLVALVSNLLQSAEAFCQVAPKVASLGSCRLLSGAQIPNCRVAYRTFGQLNAGRDNAVLIPTWLLGRSEDWISLLGSDGIVDTTMFYVVVVDALGNGRSSSPSNTPQRARSAFAGLTLGDMVISQRRLLQDHLRVDHLRAVLGFSMGGMQAFEWAVRYPSKLDMAIPIAGSPRVGTFDRVLWAKYLEEIETGRRAQMKPEQIWLRIVQLDALLGQTPSAVNKKSWDSLQVQLRSDAAGLAKTWHLDDLASQLRAIQRYDVSEQTAGDLSKAASAVRTRMLVIASPQDHIVTADASRDFARRISADTLWVTSDCGHGALWCEGPAIKAAIKTFMSTPSM